MSGWEQGRREMEGGNWRAPLAQRAPVRLPWRFVPVVRRWREGEGRGERELPSDLAGRH